PEAPAAAPVVDPHREHVVAAPVEGVGGHGVAAEPLPLAAVAGREGTRLPDLHTVDERFVDVVDLSQLQVCRSPGGSDRESKAAAVPREPVVPGMAGPFPPFGYRDRLPGFFVVLPSAVARVVSGAEPTRPRDGEQLCTSDPRADVGGHRGDGADG